MELAVFLINVLLSGRMCNLFKKKKNNRRGCVACADQRCCGYNDDKDLEFFCLNFFFAICFVNRSVLYAAS